MDTVGSHEITQLLAAWSDGDEAAFARLVPLVYRELKILARRHMRRENEGHVLQTTALVHEAYLKLVKQKGARWENRIHFFAISGQQMRRILVDAARAQQRQKRGADAVMISLDDAPTLTDSRAAEFIALDDVLNELAKLDERRCRVVEMRYFGGLSIEETAAVLKVSVETVMRDWKAAKAWLYLQLNKTESAKGRSTSTA